MIFENYLWLHLTFHVIIVEKNLLVVILAASRIVRLSGNKKILLAFFSVHVIRNLAGSIVVNLVVTTKENIKSLLFINVFPSVVTYLVYRHYYR